MFDRFAPSEASYVVARPRDCDSVGNALRDAYARQPVPHDMLALLAQLNGVTAPAQRVRGD